MGLSTGAASAVDSLSKVRVIGLTGGIGTGKSVVARLLQSLGHPVYDADGAAKRLYRTDEALLNQLRTRFGEEMMDASGKVNRRVLADIVFRDSEALADLNGLVHPAVRRDFGRWLDRVEHRGWVFREAAILFESGANKDCDAVWAVTAPESVRMDRVRARSGWSEDEVRSRMAHQWSPERVNARANAVVVNDGIVPLMPQLERLLEIPD